VKEETKELNSLKNRTKERESSEVGKRKQRERDWKKL
jgi:hypothetical protein